MSQQTHRSAPQSSIAARSTSISRLLAIAWDEHRLIPNLTFETGDFLTLEIDKI